jgi:hypothetical protein
MRKTSLWIALTAALMLSAGILISTQADPLPAGVDLGPDQTQQALPGENVTYSHVLTNTGELTDTFSVDVLSTQGWPVGLTHETHPTSTQMLDLDLGAQMSTTFEVSLTVPSYAGGMIEITVVTATSQLSPTVQDMAVDTTHVRAVVHLPLAIRRWPPLPYQPTLHPIGNPDSDHSYTVSWTEQPSRLADNYTLEEATNHAFTGDLREACTTTGQSCEVSGRSAGTYYYRVQGHNIWGDGPYSGVRSTTVLPPVTPSIDPISNADGDGDYTVTWRAAARATWYKLQEDTDSGFGSPQTVYQGPAHSWDATGKSPDTYHYRVKAVGPTGQSEWSNRRSVVVDPLPQGVLILSSNAFVPYEGSSSLYIVGEVLNNTGSNAEFVEISATLRDGSGDVVDSDFTYSMIDRLSRDMKSPFLIIFLDPPNWSSYELTVDWDTTRSGPYHLDILNTNSYFDTYDEYHVVGEIRNGTSGTRTFVKAFVTMYDPSGDVIGADYTYTNPDELDPGETASFDAGVYFWKGKPNRSRVAHHRLQVLDD